MSASRASSDHNDGTPLIAVCLLLTAALVSSISIEVGAQFNPVYPKPYQGKPPGLVKPLYHFTSNLYRNLNGSGNIILSPISIHTALNMVLPGADANSTTKRELMDTLGYSGLSDDKVRNYYLDYHSILTKFEEITRETLAKLNKSRPTRHHDEDEWEFRTRQASEVQVPTTPVLDMFNMMITKNKGKVNSEYEKTIEKYFHSSSRNVDDEDPESKTKVMENLNVWGKKAGFDKPILKKDDLDRDIAALLVSAIRFQANWFLEFEEIDKEGMFFNHGLKNKPVNGTALRKLNIMASKYMEFTPELRATDKIAHRHFNKPSSPDHSTFRQLNKLNFRVAQVPLYGDLTFTIFEPLEHSTPEDNKLKKLVSQLCEPKAHGNETNLLAKAIRLLDEDRSFGAISRLTMPKFKFEKKLTLNNVLKSMGLRAAFSKDKAEISSIMTRPVHIGRVQHQAMIEVDKIGIKAAGVTSVEFFFTSGPPPGSEIDINKPFMFLIRYQKIPLFIGQLTNLK